MKRRLASWMAGGVSGRNDLVRGGAGVGRLADAGNKAHLPPNDGRRSVGRRPLVATCATISGCSTKGRLLRFMGPTQTWWTLSWDLPEGSYQWWVQTWGDSAYGPWSEEGVSSGPIRRSSQHQLGHK